MSFEAVLWATNDAPIADVNEFAVLVMLAERADPDGCTTFPSRPTMAERTHIDPKTVLRTLQRMEKRRLIGKGDQSAAAYLRRDRRPVVYDILIPFAWFPNIDRINKERAEKGKPPLTPQSRPPIVAPPAKVRRSDLGKKRPRKKSEARGDSESPREDGDAEDHGVTVSPARGDSESVTGGLRDTRTSSLNLSCEPAAPSAHRAADARRASCGSSGRAQGGSAASGKSKPRRTPADLAAIRAVWEELGRQIPDLHRALPERAPTNIGDAILAGLALGTPQARTAHQLVRFRVLPRWDKHWASLFYAGKLPNEPIGPLSRMLAAEKADHDRCDERVDVDSGDPCRACEMRNVDRSADRKQRLGTPEVSEMAGSVPAQRETPAGRPKCPECHRPLVNATEATLCRDCRHDAHV